MKTGIINTLPTVVEHPGAEYFSPAELLGELISEKMRDDSTFYLFSPDETTSNRLDAAYNSTSRSWAMPTEPWDLPEAENGRIIELLSENALFATMVGHILGSHEPAMMTSYESFFSIITSQVIQYLKFLEQTSEAKKLAKTPIQDYPAANLISTSTCWRQDHNGFSHQSPTLISTLLSIPNAPVNCLFPADDISAAATFEFMDTSENVVNLTTFNKTEEPRWIDLNHARFQFKNGGASVFGFATNADAENADFILTSAGDIATREALRTVEILHQDLPDLKIRFIGINALSYNKIGTTKTPLSQEAFVSLFGYHTPIIANFHGFPDTLKNILRNYTSQTIYAHGFMEQGRTITPLEMLRLNHASRYDLAIDAAKICNREDLVRKYQDILSENHAYALTNGIDKITIL